MRISDWSSDVCSSSRAGLTARIPLYQGGAVASRVRQAQAQQSQALENMVLTARFVVNQARATFANLQTARAEKESSEATVSVKHLALAGGGAGKHGGRPDGLAVRNARQAM